MLNVSRQFGSNGPEAGERLADLVRSHRVLVCSSLVGLATAAILALPSPAAAQDGLAMWRVGCTACHGGFATGGGGNENPAGPNLRTSSLDRESLRETIACGRGEMPYHLQGAYLEVPCYGTPAGDPPPEGLNAGSRQFSEAELDSLVDFLMEYVVGVPLTREVCGVYFGGDANAPACAQFPE